MKPTTLNELKEYSLDQILSEEEKQALKALSQLVLYRNAWINPWKPDYTVEYHDKYSITCFKDQLMIYNNSSWNYIFTFPTRAMAKEFMETFKDLLETAKPLL